MTKEHFNKRARDWDSDPAKVERARIIAQEIDNFIHPEGKLNAFEFGCGTGLLSYFLRDAFKSITLADNSEGMIEVLKEKIVKDSVTNFTPLLTDLLHGDPPPCCFDVVYTLMTLHHIMDLDKIFRIFYHMLNKGGYLCIADLDTEDGTFHNPQQNFQGHPGFDRNEIMSLLSKHGFRVELYKICTEIEKTVDGKQRKYPVFLLIGVK
ncbi:MAG: class I SAM-dependent methyltransferase [Bacteroidales bacterium]|nr:class I SAM-dependent methyltransferase [Bacteroidales bacterium]